MSKREPLLSDEQQYDFCREAGEPVDQPEYCGGPALYSARHVRDFYERLIDEGRLRVVEEVNEDPTDHIYKCCKMHVIGSTMSSVNFCPGCGSKIKR